MGLREEANDESSVRSIYRRLDSRHSNSAASFWGPRGASDHTSCLEYDGPDTDCMRFIMLSIMFAFECEIGSKCVSHVQRMRLDRPTVTSPNQRLAEIKDRTKSLLNVLHVPCMLHDFYKS